MHSFPLGTNAAQTTYLDDPAGSAAVFRDGWTRMGDVGRLDADGYLHLLDWESDMVQVGGFKVATLGVEAVLFAHPDVADAAVLGVPHPVLGTTLVAAVVPRNPCDTAELRAFVRARLTEAEVPSRIELVAELPRNDGGKVRKRDLVDLFTAPGTAPLRTVDERTLATLWAQVLSVPEVAANANFFALGGDSFRAADLAAAVTDAFGVEVPTTFAFDVPDHMPLVVHLDGQVDVTALRAAVGAVLRRHPLLGMAVADRDGVPHLMPTTPVVTETDDDVAEVLRRETAQPFAGPLCRCTLVRCDGGVSLVAVAHHLVFDGTSKDVLVYDLAAAYNGELDLDPVPFAPVDDESALPAAREFWAEHWHGHGDLVLPGLRHGDENATVGIDVSTRGDGDRQAIGPFVNELPVHIGRCGTFRELAAAVRTRLRETYRFRGVPLERAVPGLPLRPAVAPTSISYRKRRETRRYAREIQTGLAEYQEERAGTPAT